MRQVMRQESAAPRQRRDPAPSRWRYRLHRMMLTPSYRRLVRIGLPLVVVAGVAGAWFGQESNRVAVQGAILSLRDQIQTRPEFMVNAMDVEGADETLEAEIRRVLPIDFPVSSFDLDLEEMRQLVAAVNAVAGARLQVRPGGILEVSVTQRVPVAVWRGPDGLRLIDGSGHVVSGIAERADRADLPLIAGIGARDALDEAQEIFVAASPLGTRMRGLVRRGERRWDVVLEDEQRIMLPTEAPVAALERVLMLDSAQDMLDRDIAVVDMRNEARPTIRMGPAAAAAYRRASATPTATDGQ